MNNTQLCFNFGDIEKYQHLMARFKEKCPDFLKYQSYSSLYIRETGPSTYALYKRTFIVDVDWAHLLNLDIDEACYLIYNIPYITWHWSVSPDTRMKFNEWINENVN